MSTATASRIPVPRKAEKKRVKLKMAVQGPSGSGKTWGALALAKNLWPNGRVCVIDTENESASLYADSFEFDTITLTPPFTTARYVEAIDVVVKAGYHVLIIDSITPQWDGEGGILRRKEEMDKRPGSNSYTNWASFTPEHEAFKQAMVQAPIHLIATMRSKQDYVLVANDKGKQVPTKMGMAPIQRDQMDYEFTLVFDVQMDHRALASKDRTGLFSEQIVDLASDKSAAMLRGWLGNGKEETPGPSLVHRQLEAAVKKVTLTEEIEKHATTDDYRFHVTGNIVTCRPVQVLNKKTKGGKDYMFLKLDAEVEGQLSGGFCYHASLFDALGKIKEQQSVCQFEWSVRNNFLQIDNVLDIDGIEYRDGKPYNQDAEPESLEINDDDIPF